MLPSPYYYRFNNPTNPFPTVILLLLLLCVSVVIVQSWTTSQQHLPTSITNGRSLHVLGVLSSRQEFFTKTLIAGGWIAATATSSPSASNTVNNNDPSSSSSSSSNLVVSQLEPESAKFETGLLDSRVQSNVLNPPPYGMEGSDIFYPDWFAGNWKIRSETKDVQAPCGIALFGGNTTYNNARMDIGNVLNYESRFIRDMGQRVIADREFNVKSIAKVAMGENSVVDVSIATPNKFSCLLAPKGSPAMISVDLIVLNRRQEAINDYQFDCSEVVREVASPIIDNKPKPQQPPPILKEIETTSLYTYLPEKDEIHCVQRSAAFLLPSNQNEMAMKMWQLSQGKAIDVRFYDVVYTR